MAAVVHLALAAIAVVLVCRPPPLCSTVAVAVVHLTVVGVHLFLAASTGVLIILNTGTRPLLSLFFKSINTVCTMYVDFWFFM